MGDLKPCPFCGGEASGEGHARYNQPLADTRWADGSEITECFFVNCIKCGVDNGRPGLVGGYQTKAEAIAPQLAELCLSQSDTIARLTAEVERLREVERAARDLPRETPSAGTAETLHGYHLPAWAVWANDLALKKLDHHRAALNPLPAKEGK